MQPGELSFYTTQELIDELMRRKTFCGVVLHATDEQKEAEWAETRIFRVHYNENLDTTSASRLLETVSHYLDANLA